MSEKNKHEDLELTDDMINETNVSEDLVDVEAKVENKKPSVEELTKENKELVAEIADLQKALKNMKDNQQKLMLATKVNTLKEQSIINEDFKKYAKQKVIEETVLPVLLNFERALNFETNDKKVKNFLVGFKYIFNNLKESLIKEGLTPISIPVGSIFDSHTSEAIATEVVGTLTPEQKNNMVVEQIAMGYKLYDRVVSPAKVKIIKHDQKLTKENQEISKGES